MAPTLTDEDFRRMKKEVPEYLQVGLASPPKTLSTTAESLLKQQDKELALHESNVCIIEDRANEPESEGMSETIGDKAHKETLKEDGKKKAEK